MPRDLEKGNFFSSLLSSKDWTGRVQTIAWSVWGGSEHSGILCMVFSSLLYSIMGLMVKILAAQRIPSFETVMIRSAIVALYTGGVLYHNQTEAIWGRRENRVLLIARALIGFVAISCFFHSISELPLKDATIINFTSPMFTAIIARVFLGETWGLPQIFAALTSFVGVTCIARPPFLFPPETGTNAELGGYSTDAQMRAVVIGVIGAACAGAAYTMVRAVGKSGEPPLTSVLWFSTLSVPASALGLALFQTPIWPDAWEMVAMATVGTAAFGGQALLSRGLQLERAARATSMQYVKVLFSYLIGVVILHESPTVIGTLGALLIAASAMLVMKQKVDERTGSSMSSMSSVGEFLITS